MERGERLLGDHALRRRDRGPARPEALLVEGRASALDPQAAEPVAEAEAAAEPEGEPVKIVGPLRIGIPLFNIYLNEADELSRRLVTELSEWALELHRPVGETVIALALVLPLAAIGQGKTLRFASAFNPQTMDPHALALLYQTRVVTQVYEGLVHRGKDFKLEGSLATSWEMVNPTTWRFKLRPDVKFHDGAPFTDDDAVFSIERALDNASQRKNQMLGISGARKIDASTIDVVTAQPDAVLPEKLWLRLVRLRSP